ncbi:TPA: COX15/CtaA family protein [Photobacterium damselae]
MSCSYAHQIWLSRFIVATFIFSIVVVGLGAFTRLTESGLGCPDWPGCYGFLAVPSNSDELRQAQQLYPEQPVEASKAWYEMVHRYVAGTLGVLILLLNILAWRWQAKEPLLPKLLLLLVLFQSALGMWTVTLNLMPIVVMGHLLGGFTLVSLLWLWYQKRHTEVVQTLPADKTRLLQGYLGLLLVIVIGQIALGGWTAANYAALVCTSLPICQVNWVGQFQLSAFDPIPHSASSYQYGILDYGQRVSIHVAHRIGAIVTAIVTIGAVIWLWQWRHLRLLSYGLSTVLLLQVGLGITNVVASLPLSVAVAHNVMGLTLLLIVIKANYQVWLCRRADSYQTLHSMEGGING